MDAIENELWLAIVGFHRLIDNLSKTWVVANEEPRVNRNAMTTYTRTRLEDVYARMHVADLNNFVNIHIVMTADTSEFVSEGNIDSTESILYNLSHLSRTDVSYDDFALTE